LLPLEPEVSHRTEDAKQNRKVLGFGFYFIQNDSSTDYNYNIIIILLRDNGLAYITISLFLSLDLSNVSLFPSHITSWRILVIFIRPCSMLQQLLFQAFLFPTGRNAEPG
jgi:hypothetical protein